MASAPRLQIDLTTGCACGAVGITVRGEVLAMLLCSCEDCQKCTGGGHSAAFSVAAADLSVSGELTSFSRPADSGATLTRHFCPACSTPIYARSSRAERLVLVPAGLFGAASEWFRPNQLVFARSHLEWDMIDEDLPRHDTYRPRTNP